MTASGLRSGVRRSLLVLGRRDAGQLTFSRSRSHSHNYSCTFLRAIIFKRFPFLLPPCVVCGSFIFRRLLLRSRGFPLFLSPFICSGDGSW